MRYYYCLLALLIIVPITTWAQMNGHWQIVGHFPGNVVPTFVNDSLGFALGETWTLPQGGLGLRPIQLTDAIPSLYKTTDAGVSWEPVYDTPWGGVGPISLYFVSDKILYVACGVVPPYGDPTDAGGVYKSTDGGYSWKRITPSGVRACDVVAQGDTLYVSGASDLGGSDLGIGFSWDRGRVWHFAKFDSRMPFHRNCSLSSTTTGSVTSTGADLDFYAVSTTDGGQTWRESNRLLSSAWSSCGVRGTSTYFAAEEEGGSDPSVGFDHFRNCHIAKSTDNGLTWIEIATPGVNSQRLNGAIAAGPCGAVYAQRSWMDGDSGLIRSTDLGKSWVDVGGPPGVIDSKSISVVGTGATVFAMDLDRNIWRTTDGGDGALSSNYWPFIQIAHFSGSGDTVETRLCDSAVFYFCAMNTGCLSAKIDSVSLGDPTYQSDTGAVVDSSVDVTSRTYLHDRLLNASNGWDTARVVVYPPRKGVFSLRVHGRIRREDWLMMDTAFTIVLKVDANPGILSYSTNDINFGAQTLCSALIRSDTIRVSATGCEAVTIDSIVFRPTDGTSTDFVFTSPASFMIGSSDKARAFPITFKPTHPAKESGTIYIYSSNGVDSIQVTGEGVADSRAFIADRDTLRVQMCDSSDGVFRISNTTCGSLIIDSVTLADGFTLPLASNGKPQLPLPLGRDQQEDITIRYEPSAGSNIGASSVSVTAHVRYLGKGDTVSFDTVLTLPLVVSRGTPSLALTEQSLDLGVVSTCAADTVSLGILSDGCDTLQITSASLASGASITLVRKPGSSLPTGASDSVLIGFAPSTTGTVMDTLILTTNAGVRRIPITATGVAGTKTIAQSENAIDFGKLAVCQDSSRTVTLTNKGCADITITDANLTGQGFAYSGSLPITLKPGESITLPVTTTTDTTGHPTTVTGTLAFTTNAENALTPITLTRGFVYPAHLKIEAVDDASGHAGDLVKFKLLLQGDIPKGMSALYFDLSNDDDLLSFLASSGVSMVGTGGTNETTRTFRLSPVTDTGEIGELTFRAYLAKASTTSLTLSNLHFDYPNLTVPPDCIATIEGSGSDFTYIYQCGEGLIQHYLLGEPLVIESISPNPASKTIAVRTRGAESIELLDVLGREVMAIVPSSVSSLDVSRVAPGTYYLRVTGGGAVRTARVVVER